MGKEGGGAGDRRKKEGRRENVGRGKGGGEEGDRGRKKRGEEEKGGEQKREWGRQEGHQNQLPPLCGLSLGARGSRGCPGTDTRES